MHLEAATVLKNFANVTGKHLCWNLFFTKLKAFRPVALLKKKLLRRCFLVKFAKLRTPILKNMCERLLLCIDLQFTKVLIFHFYK